MTAPVLQIFLKALQRFLRNNALLRLPVQRLLILWSYLTRYARKIRTKGSSDPSRHPEDETSSEAPSVVEEQQNEQERSTIICASEAPSSLHPYPPSTLGASASSQDVRTETLRPTFSRSHISYPTTSGNLNGSRTALTASPAASVSRLSITIPRAESTHLAVNQDDAASVASRISIIAPDITAEPTPLVESPSQGYTLTGEVTTSPVQESENVTLAGEAVDLTGPGLCATYDAFYTALPEKFARYDRPDIIPSQVTTYELPPMTVRFDNGKLPLGWKELLHPEGARYFLYEPKKLYTDANIYNTKVLSYVTNLISQCDQYLRSRNIRLSSHVNIVFDICGELDEMWCQYYLADHATRTVFWLDKFELSEENFHLWSEVKGVTEMSHVRHAIEVQYWHHCDLFPDSFSLGLSHVDELRDILIHSIGDVVTSLTTTVPYEVYDLQQMLKVANSIRKNVESSKCASVYSRLMYLFARQRFFNFHGQPAARLDRDRSIYHPSDYKPPRTPLLRILSPLMFSAPDTHCRALDKLWVDGIIHATSWNKFISNMNTEWEQLILFGTVLLNANVAFLAIQSVDEDTANPDRSPAQIASYLSVVASIGSVIIGLMLQRKNKIKNKEAADDAAVFLHSFMKNRLGLETLAILYSVPYALLMWGVILFLAGFSSMCLYHSAIGITLLVCGAWLIIALLVVWCIFTLAQWDKRFNAQDTAWDKLIIGIQEAVRATTEFSERQLVALGLKNEKEEEPVVRLTAPVRRMSLPVKRMSEALRRASRKATIFSTFSRLTSGENRHGSGGSSGIPHRDSNGNEPASAPV
ncbi:hypothetical protein VNI00_015400 [Paramarasmius palmivorus]|uniref:Uncharacterized protein n=1 Tax=Paramarasmius palmivorus TaxID=297713 RepID=A0AAW0BLF7_9AGAR